MCDDNHPLVLDKRFFVNRRNVADGTIIENDPLSETSPFPAGPSTLTGLPSKMADSDVVETRTDEGPMGFRGPAHT